MPLERTVFLEFGEHRADPHSGVLMRGAEVIPLPPKAFEVLMALLESGGSPVTREQLMTTVWGETFVEEGNLTQAISVLRKALGEAAGQPRYIITIPRRGYQLGVPVTEAGGEPESPSQPETAAPPHHRPRWLAVVVPAIVLGLPLGAWWWTNRPLSAPIQSIAVLPLQNLSGDPNQDYFSDGTTEALISNLAQIHSLAVISRTSIMRYKGTTKPAREIGRELGVDAIVEGSVQRSGGRVRITAQLIRAATDKHLWAKEYERDFTDVLSIEADVTQAIAREIQAQVTPGEAQRLASVGNIKPEAWEQYMLGRHHYWRGGPEDYQTAIHYFERAAQIQPDYASAYAGLAIAWTSLIGSPSAPDAHERVRTNALKALELDPNLAEAHAALSALAWQDWDWAGSEREIKTARALANNNVFSCACYATLLYTLGRFPEALAQSEDALRADPLSPTTHQSYGTVLVGAGRPQEAVPHLLRALELDPQNRLAHTFLSFAYEHLGRTQDAFHVLDGPEFHPSFELAFAFAVAGQRAEALRVLSDVIKARKTPATQIAQVYYALGDQEQGLKWLTTAFDRHEGVVAFVRFSTRPEFQSDPRFQALMARLRLPN